MVNIHEAKTTLSQLIASLESGDVQEVIIARYGKPVARLVPLAPSRDVRRRVGVARNLFVMPDNIDAGNQDIAALFDGGRG